MGDTKLEISGRTTDDPPPATFKTISESDTEETALQEAKIAQKNMSKTQNSNSEADGADEKMLENEEKPLTEDSKIDIADAKISLNADKQNGEAKLDIGDLKPAFVGMGKEELMKYANDPFWVNLRWVLFVAFWLLWLAMLIGAILIIIAAPKCAPPTPRTWWERGPLTEVSHEIDAEALELIKTKKIQAVIVNSAIDPYTPPEESPEIVNFLKLAKEKEINVIIGLSPTNTDKFFEQSESNDDNYMDYYLWVDSKGRNENGEPIEPNNWLSPKGGKAWKYSEKRQKFYYSPQDLPTLNFRNPKVVDEFTSMLKLWLAAGVTGVQLSGVPHMLVDENFRNWTMGSEPGHVHDEYQFYRHIQTTNVDGIGDILREWRKIVKNHSEEISMPFMLSEDLTSLDAYLVNDSLTIDLPRHSNVFTIKDRVSSASEIYKGVNSAFNILGENWPLWRYVETSLPSDVMDILTMLLPGSILVDSEHEVNPQLTQIREVPSVMFGSCHRELLANDTIFAYQRVQAGNPGYIVACNPSDKLVTVDFSVMKNVSEEVTVQVLSNNFTIPNIETSLKVPANAFQMPPMSAVVLTYVPK